MIKQRHAALMKTFTQLVLVSSGSSEQLKRHAALILKLLDKHQNRMEIVCTEIADAFDLTLEEIQERSRAHPRSLCRALCYLVLREKYNFSTKQIGDFFNRDHSTIVIATQRARDDVAQNYRNMGTIYKNFI